MNSRTALVCISLLATSHIQAEEYYLEEFSDTAIENKADAAIRKYAARDVNWLSKCKFTREEADFGEDSDGTYIIVTTTNGCGWGTAAGPVWLLKHKNEDYSVLLSSSGYTFETTEQISNGLPNVKISSGSAGWFNETHWSYNGRKYIKTNERSGVRYQETGTQ